MYVPIAHRETMQCSSAFLSQSRFVLFEWSIMPNVFILTKTNCCKNQSEGFYPSKVVHFSFQSTKTNDKNIYTLRMQSNTKIYSFECEQMLQNIPYRKRETCTKIWDFTIQG